MTASGLATALARSVDQILIGWLWGPAVLGLYERTTRLVLLPVNTINAPVYAAGMPALSRLIDQPERYRSMFRQIMQKLALLTMPVFAMAAVLADWLVRILFGPTWTQAVAAGGAVQRVGGLSAGADGGQPALHDAGPDRARCCARP